MVKILEWYDGPVVIELDDGTIGVAVSEAMFGPEAFLFVYVEDRAPLYAGEIDMITFILSTTSPWYIGRHIDGDDFEMTLGEGPIENFPNLPLKGSYLLTD